MFTDESVRCAGPIRPGPSLPSGRARSTTTRSPAWRRPTWPPRSAGSSATTFPTRLVQSATSSGSSSGAGHRCPPDVEVVDPRRHRPSTCSTSPTDASASCSTGEPTTSSSTPSCWRSATSTPTARRRRAAPPPPTRASPTCPPATRPSRTCRCCGRAPTSSPSASARRSPTSRARHRGAGRSLRRAGAGRRAALRAERREPVLHVGSRRGVPYRAKLDYRLQAPPAPLPRFLDRPTVDALLAQRRADRVRPRPVPARRQGGRLGVLPRAVPRPRRAHDVRLGRLRRALRRRPFGPRARAPSSPTACRPARTASTSPRIDRPLAGRRFASADELHD